MALQMSISCPKADHDDDDNNNDNDGDDENHLHEYDEEIEETEDDLIKNYRYLTKHCGVLRQSPTTSVLNVIQQQQKQANQTTFSRQYSSMNRNHDNNNRENERSTKPRCSPLNDLNNNNQNYPDTISRIPPTIYYDDTEDDVAPGPSRSFSLVKLFARMKARLKHDKRYRPKPTHELLYEEDPLEWYELTKNVRTVLTKALLPDGGYDAMINRAKTNNSRQNSCKKSRELEPVLSKTKDIDEDRIELDIDDEFNTEGDEEYDQIIWNKFLTCSRGFNYRRCGTCKTVDRQQYQGQLVYFYGVANNILIDENLKASGLG